MIPKLSLTKCEFTTYFLSVTPGKAAIVPVKLQASFSSDFGQQGVEVTVLCSTLELRFNEVVDDRPNLFVK